MSPPSGLYIISSIFTYRNAIPSELAYSNRKMQNGN